MSFFSMKKREVIIISQNIVDKDIDKLYDEIEKLKGNITSLQSSISSNYSAITKLQNKNYYYYNWPFFSLEAGKAATKTVAFNSSGKPFIVLFKVNHNCKSEHSWTKIEIKRESTIVSVSVCEGYSTSNNEDCIAVYLDSSKIKGIINYTFSIKANSSAATYSDKNENATPKIIMFEI